MPCIANVNSLRTKQYDVMNSEFEHYSSILTARHGGASGEKAVGARRSEMNCLWKLWRSLWGHSCLVGDSRHVQGQGGWSHERQKRPHEDGGGWKVFGNIFPKTSSWSVGCQMSNTLPLGQTRDLRSRSNSGGREEVAGGGVGEVLEERGEGAQPCHRPSMEVVQD